MLDILVVSPHPDDAELLRRYAATRAEDAFVELVRRLALTAIYGPLFRSLGLSSVQSEKFLDLTLKGEEQQMDLSAVMRSRAVAIFHSAAERASRKSMGSKIHRTWSFEI